MKLPSYKDTYKEIQEIREKSKEKVREIREENLKNKVDLKMNCYITFLFLTTKYLDDY